ncbi:MAG: ATP-binding cassette domain-containing protein [Suipraeoptans sp.]
MLQIKNICKKYKTGDLIQDALNDVTLNFRDNEFVAVLGPSGSGKTTLLNIVGGLDKYDSGDLIINGLSTKDYSDRDWDSYRNHSIGFVFQSYNLIPHQSILSNVELALTISGISKDERRERAKLVLSRVGLEDHTHKKPNQLSGGQMQRVAIARALINDPDILLADEPTGALDSTTSVQVMELLKEVAKDKLVIMVTHNPELAEEYATRTVKLRDARIKSDSNPYEIDESDIPTSVKNTIGKSSMSLITSLSLSFNNLKTKKGRTFLTAFAGSIGIIGIALILALSTGVNQYIDDIQKETMTSYPISIDSETIDVSSLMSQGSQMVGMGSDSNSEDIGHDLDGVYSNPNELEMENAITSSTTENNLTEFKKYMDDPNSKIQEHLGENGVIYSYDIAFDVYSYDSDENLINADGSTIAGGDSESGSIAFNPASDMNDVIFSEILPGQGDKTVSSVVTDSYDCVYGDWPTNYDEVVLVLDESNEVSQTSLYNLGLLPLDEYNDIREQMDNDENFNVETSKLSYDDIINHDLYLIPSCDYYSENEDGTFENISDDADKLDTLLTNDSLKLKITGIIRPVDDAANANISGVIGYSSKLTDYLIEKADSSAVVNAQRDNPDKNILSNINFEPASDEERIADAKEYIADLGVSDKASLFMTIAGTSADTGGSDAQSENYQSAAPASEASEINEVEVAAMADSYFETASDDVFLSVYDSYISPGSYDDNMTTFGYVSLNVPSSISIYADNFEDKNAISECIEEYNSTVSDGNKITYTDYVALLMSSITTIINVISYVLIAFVAVSLIVSSIMIGIITYISVLERTKEIGILRAIGASKKNISQVFNAETFIIGLCSGLLGIGISSLLLIPGNAIIHALTGSTAVNATIPINSALILIALSVILTLIGGLIPAKGAAKKDPVAALRTE